MLSFVDYEAIVKAKKFPFKINGLAVIFYAVGLTYVIVVSLCDKKYFINFGLDYFGIL